MLANIRPAVEHFTEVDGEKTSGNERFMHMVAVQNVRMAIQAVRRGSPILKEMEQRGEIKIVGGMYEMSTGRVSVLDES